MNQDKELIGKTILITGATDGIGKEFALMTRQAGARLRFGGTSCAGQDLGRKLTDR